MSRTKGAKDKQPRKKTGSSAKPKKQNDKAVKQPPIPKKKADTDSKKKMQKEKSKNKVVIARKTSNGKSGFTVKRVESV